MGTAFEDTGLALSELTLAAVQGEATRAHVRHGPNSMMNPTASDERRLAILAEEFGEVARELNEAVIHARPVEREHLVTELIQTAAMAASWAEVLEGSR